ncbi:hypothetical protein L1887_20103 [Cichorium endivia]|nr:hypothetical protein L1887_20103 [Cichorium endivia]
MEKAQKLIFIVGRSRVEKRDFSNDDEKDAEFFAVANDEDDMLICSMSTEIVKLEITFLTGKPLAGPTFFAARAGEELREVNERDGMVGASEVMHLFSKAILIRRCRKLNGKRFCWVW